MGRKSGTKKMRDFEINLRKLKLLLAEKRELLRQKEPQKLKEFEKFISEIEKETPNARVLGWVNQKLWADIQYLEHLDVRIDNGQNLKHEEVVDKVSKWFAEKGYTMDTEVPFTLKGLDFRVDVFLYKPKEWVGVECKGSIRGSSEIIKGLGQVLVYRESFNLAYLASSDSIVSSEIIKELAKKEGFGVLLVKDSIEEVVKPKRRFTVAAKCLQPSLEQKWRPENQRRVIAVLRHYGRVEKERLAKLVSNTYNIPVHEVQKAISELKAEKVIGIDENDYILLS